MWAGRLQLLGHHHILSYLALSTSASTGASATNPRASGVCQIPDGEEWRDQNSWNDQTPTCL